MKNIRKTKDGFYEGECEFPNCDKTIKSPLPNKRYCQDHIVERTKNTKKFYKEIKEPKK